MKIPKSDLLFALVGLGTTVTIFLAQGPYDKAWKYGLALSPLVVSILAIAGYRAYKKAQHFYLALVHAKEAYDLVTATDINSIFNVRIMNEDGDLLYERYFNIKLLKDGVAIRKTKYDLVSSESPIDDFPPSTKVHSSYPNNIALHPADITKSKPIRGGRTHHDYRWCYEINPPLRNKDDFIEYGYSALIPKCEPGAFQEQGALFFFHHESIPLDVNYSLMAPPKYKIHIMESWMEDQEGRRKELPQEDLPQLEKGEQYLKWHPHYRKRMCFICKYRLIEAAMNNH